jgi:hypothetical protein
MIALPLLLVSQLTEGSPMFLASTIILILAATILALFLILFLTACFLASSFLAFVLLFLFAEQMQSFFSFQNQVL